MSVLLKARKKTKNFKKLKAKRKLKGITESKKNAN